MIWFLVGFLSGIIVFWCYSWITDKLNLARLGYTGGKWLYVKLVNRKKRISEKEIETLPKESRTSSEVD